MRSVNQIASKGRVIVTRPFVCVAFIAALALLIAPAARAELLTPSLTSSNPTSPSASSAAPRLKGVVEEAQTKVVTFGVALRAFTRAESPSNTVRIYTAANCTRPVAGEGSVEALTGAGILLAPVAADSVTYFYANQSDGVETSACSPGFRYRQVTTPPEAPVITAIDPPSPANDNFPRLGGSADPDGTVSIFPNGTCSGAPSAGGSAAQFEAGGVQVGVPDNSENVLSAQVTLAGFVSACSGPVEYKEVTPPPTETPGGSSSTPGGGSGVGGGAAVAPPPAPKLRTVPGGTANNNTPLVTGSAPGAGSVRIYASADCQGPVVARGFAAEFLAGLPIRVVDNAVVVLSAVALAGETGSRCSAPVVYVEDSLTPRTRITMAPAAKTAKRKAVIRFTDTTGSAPGTVFLCKVDKKKWKRCSSPLRLKKLKPRRYVVRVKASDPAGNVELKGASRSFRVIAAG